MLTRLGRSAVRIPFQGAERPQPLDLPERGPLPDREAEVEDRRPRAPVDRVMARERLPHGVDAGGEVHSPLVLDVVDRRDSGDAGVQAAPLAMEDEPARCQFTCRVLPGRDAALGRAALAPGEPPRASRPPARRGVIQQQDGSAVLVDGGHLARQASSDLRDQHGVVAAERATGKRVAPWILVRHRAGILRERERLAGSPGNDHLGSPSVSRLSSYFLPTLREDPADAEALSHRLMVRAGLVRQVGAGLWTFLPAGYRVVKRVEQILREEIDAIGGQEMLMPVLQPAELWRRTGRYEIDELFKLKDRKDADLALAMTHEEVLTFHIAREVRSYRELPMILYHVQIKERDEQRPRAGVLRTREFTMKDSYSFDRDAEGLDRSYELHIQAYDRIFDRCGLRWYRVEADVGMMGGSGAHEYLAPCEAGENEVALAPGYAANIEVASAEPQPVDLPPPLDEPREVPTPGLTTVEEVSSALGV